MNWALMNHYDEKGEMIMPRPRGKEADEDKFIRWVCHQLHLGAKTDRETLAERRANRFPVSQCEVFSR